MTTPLDTRAAALHTAYRNASDLAPIAWDALDGRTQAVWRAVASASTPDAVFRATPIITAGRGTPEYVEALADLVDTDQHWRLAGMDQLELPPAEMQKLDAGVYLRRHAARIRTMRELIGTGKSLVLTPTDMNVTDVRTMKVDLPPVKPISRTRKPRT